MSSSEQNDQQWILHSAGVVINNNFNRSGDFMRYFLAILCPPLAVLLCGKPIQFILNIFLTLLLWVPGVIHAILVVNSHLSDKRTERLESAIRAGASPKA